MNGVSTSLAAFARPMNVLVNGASRGIGFAFVEALLADASVHRVFATARHGAHATALVDLEAAHLRAIDMDVSDESSVRAGAAAVREETDRIDLVVNCAGLLHDGEALQPEKRLADVDPAALARSFAVNATGPLLVAKHFHRLLPRRERAVFASLSARVGSISDNRLGGWYGYRASKAAQNMITRNLAIELRRTARGVICVALHPGTVDTGLSRPFQGNVASDRLFTAAHAAHQLLGVIDGLGPGDNGGFFAWDAQPVPW